MLLLAPHDEFLSVAEAMALAGCDALASGARSCAFDRFDDWLAAADVAMPLQGIVAGFALESPERALLALLFAAALSEPLARRLSEIAPPGGQGVPLWLAQQIVPTLRVDSLAAAGVLRHYGLVAIEEGALRVEARIWLREPIVDRFCGALAVEPEVASRIMRAPVRALLADERLGEHLRSALAERCGDGLSPVVIAKTVEPAMVVARAPQRGRPPPKKS